MAIKAKDKSILLNFVILFLMTPLCTSLKPGVFTECPVPAIASPCPEGWKLTPEPYSCVIDLGLTFKLSWSMAQAQCARYGATLLRIASKEMNDFIKDMVKKHSPYQGWMGLYLSYNRGHWVWTKNQGLDMSKFTYQNWGPPQKHGPWAQLNCAYFTTDGRWRKGQCSHQANFLCQKLIEGQAPCPQNWKLTPEPYSCIIALGLSKKLAWSIAQHTCSEVYNADLLRISNKATNDFIKDLVSNDSSYLGWTGLHWSYTAGGWRWAHNRGRDPMNVTYWNLAPDNYRGHIPRRCYYFTAKGNWQRGNCNDKANYFCQTPANVPCRLPAKDPPCPSNWRATNYPRSCITDLGLRKQYTWEQGRIACAVFSSDLVTVYNQAMNDFINQYNTERSFQSAWIALTDEDEEGTWAWNIGDGWTQEPRYTNWAPGHPIPGRERNCAIVRGQDEGWKSVSCEDFHTPVCVSLGSRRTTKVGKTRLTWAKATELCRGWNFRLLALHSDEDSKQVGDYTAVSKERAIGLQRRGGGNRWWWTNTLYIRNNPKALGFRNWAPGHPNETSEGNCAYMDPEGTWTDEECTKSSYIICQKPTRETCKKPSINRPGNTLLQIMFHISEKYVQYERTVQMTCTADGTEGVLAWSVYTKARGAELLVPDKITTRFVLVQTDTDQCVNRTVSEVTITASSSLRDAQISCFAMPQETPRKCDESGISSKLCAISTSIVVLGTGKRSSASVKDETSISPGAWYGVALLLAHLLLVFMVVKVAESAGLTGKSGHSKSKQWQSQQLKTIQNDSTSYNLTRCGRPESIRA